MRIARLFLHEAAPRRKHFRAAIALALVSAMLGCAATPRTYDPPGFADAAAGDQALKRGAVSEAIARYSRALAFDKMPRRLRVIVLHSRGAAYYKNGLLDKAIEDYTQAIRLDPTYRAAFYDRGLAHIFNMEAEQAVDDFSSAIRLNRDDAPAFRMRGTAYRIIGQCQMAIADQDVADRLKPGDAGVYFERGICRFALGQFSGAAEDFEQSLKSEPGNVYGALWLRLAAARTGNTSGISVLVHSVDRTTWPGTVIALYLGETTIADVRASAAQGDDKKRYLQACATAFYLGEFELGRGDRNKARALFEEARDTCPSLLVERTGAMAELARPDRQ